MKKKLLTLLGLTVMVATGSAQFCVDGGPTSTIDSNLKGLELTGDGGSMIDYTAVCPGITGVVDSTTLSVNLTAESTYDAFVEWGKCGATTYAGVGSVWIDYNGSETFEPSELIGDFTIAGGGTFSISTYNFTVPATALNGTRRMRVMQREGGSLPLDPCASFSYGSVHDFSVEITGGVDCAPPSNIVIDELTSTTVKLDWDVDPSGAWQWAIVAEGTMPGAADYMMASTFPTTGIVTDLTTNTPYDFYIRSVCGDGDSSSFIGPFTFRTLCETISGDDFCESFEADSETKSCWTVLDGNADGDAWNPSYGSLPHTGSLCAGIYTDYNAGANDDWLISPQLNLDSPKFLNFWYRVQSSGEPNDFEVLLSTTGKEPADFTNTLMALAEYSNTTYADTLIDLAAYAGMDVYIAFHIPAGGVDGWRLLIDDVCITNCPSMTDLVLNSVTSETAGISWTAGGDETEWVVSYGAPGHTPGVDGTSVSATTTDYEITGLTADTDYEVYVRTICTGGDSVAWVGPLPFHTSCLVFENAVFCESFEADSETEGCWFALDANGDGDSWDIDYTSNPHTGAQSAAIYTDYNAGANDDWLISPQMTLTGNEVMTYWQRVQSSGEPNDFEILLSTTGNNPADFTDTLLALASYSNVTYVQNTIDLGAFSGPVYVAFHVPAGGLDGWRLYFDDICFNICDPSEGEDGSVDVCLADGTTDLNGVVTGAETFGNWEYAANPSLIEGSVFNFSGLPTGTHMVEYVVVGGCSSDTAVASVTVFGAPNAGTGSTIEACMNQNVNLLAGLSGTIDTDGTWSLAGATVPTSAVSTFDMDPGTYVYTYTVSNGICADETADVTLVVGDCDYLAVDSDLLETLSVYPNPTQDVIYISTNGSAETFSYEVIDLTGRTVISAVDAVNGTTAVKVDLTAQESGIYMVKIYNSSVEKTVRIAKK